jgi:hypothetical protein
MYFAGFTLPDGAWLPPELIYLLPYFTSLTELKVTIVAIYHHMQVGGNEPLTLSDFERLTGMSRKSVVSAIKSLTGENEEGIHVLEREQVDRTFVYLPRLRDFDGVIISPLDQDDGVKVTSSSPESASKKVTTTPSEGESGAESVKVTPSNASLSLREVKLKLVRELRSYGVYLHTAQGLVEQYPEKRIREKASYFEYALRMGFANGSGWLVAAIKEDYPAPLGWNPNWKIHLFQEIPAITEGMQIDTTQSVQEIEHKSHFSVDEPMNDGELTPAKAWEMVLEQLRQELPKAAYDKHVIGSTVTKYEGGVFTITAPTGVMLVWMDGRLKSTITRILTGV